MIHNGEAVSVRWFPRLFQLTNQLTNSEDVARILFSSVLVQCGSRRVVWDYYPSIHSEDWENVQKSVMKPDLRVENRRRNLPNVKRDCNVSSQPCLKYKACCFVTLHRKQLKQDALQWLSEFCVCAWASYIRRKDPSGFYLRALLQSKQQYFKCQDLNLDWILLLHFLFPESEMFPFYTYKIFFFLPKSLCKRKLNVRVGQRGPVTNILLHSL
jgi:hypothetical protein